MKNKSVKFLSLFFVLLFLSQCGGNFFRKTDARKIPVQADERVQQNLEQGRRISLELVLVGALEILSLPHQTNCGEQQLIF
jgi:hypothetical protein